jgi:hypothetical protein
MQWTGTVIRYYAGLVKRTRSEQILTSFARASTKSAFLRACFTHEEVR